MQKWKFNKVIAVALYNIAISYDNVLVKALAQCKCTTGNIARGACREVQYNPRQSGVLVVISNQIETIISSIIHLNFRLVHANLVFIADSESEI